MIVQAFLNVEPIAISPPVTCLIVSRSCVLSVFPQKSKNQETRSFCPAYLRFHKSHRMISKFSHTTLFVTDQEKAYDFYVNKLGFQVKTDAKMANGYRWLTVTPPEQPEPEIVLMEILHESMIQPEAVANGFDDEVRHAFRILLEKGMLGAGILYTADCRATYEELKAKGVRFRGEPTDRFYGIEAVMYDDCGNCFSLTQPKPM